MNWISWLVGKDKKGIVEQVSDSVGKFIHTGEEKAAEQATQEEQVTKRWVSDNEAPISRLVRPVSYLFMTFVVFFFGALDGFDWGFEMSESFMDLYKEIYIVMTIALFGGRSYEKAKKK